MGNKRLNLFDITLKQRTVSQIQAVKTIFYGYYLEQLCFGHFMSIYHNVLIHHSDLTKENSEKGFLDSQLPVFLHEDSFEEKILENLVFQITRNPGNLLSHLRRIYACHQHNKSEQLYAALVDFLTVLENKGKKLARRMVQASSNKLNSEQVSQLRDYLSGEDQSGLVGNGFTVIKQELVGNQRVLDKAQSVSLEHDYLELAQDFIEYSQLDEAIDVLEQGFYEATDREDIQAQLLELYKVTHAEGRFRKTYALAKQNQFALIPGWEALIHFFDEQAK